MRSPGASPSAPAAEKAGGGGEGEAYVHPSEYLEFTTMPGDPLPGEEQELHEHSDEPPQTPWSPLSSAPETPATASHRIERDLMHAIPDFKNLAREAHKATKGEHRMTFTQAVRMYPKAIGWSALLSLTIVMEAFDISLIASFYAFPQFQRTFGSPTPAGGYQLSTTWQSALTIGAVVGEILGLLLNGPLLDHYGNRRVMMGSLVTLSLFVFLAFFANTPGVLLASQVLCGIPWGIYQTLTTTYAAEVMPMALRAYLTSNVNLCWVIGQFIATAMLRGLIDWDSEWSYRVPFALQWMWIVPIFVGVVFAPESPWWLVRHERMDDARKSLLRLTTAGEGFKVDETISLMKHTNEVEKYMRVGTGYRDCFRGADRRRTEICCVVWITQAVSATLTGNAAYFFEQAGLSSDRAFDLSVGMYVAGIVGAFISWGLMRVCGRRTLYLWGCGLCGVILLTAGVLGAAGADTSPPNSPSGWGLGALIVVLTLVYDSTIGPVCYSLVAEIPSTRKRVKTVVLARVAYNLLVIVTNILMPRMLNPTAWDWKGKTCFLWGAATLACFVWCYFRLPEPKGLTYIELDILFDKGASARKFKKFHGKLAETGYFSLSSKEDAGRNEWHENTTSPPLSPLSPSHTKTERMPIKVG